MDPSRLHQRQLWATRITNGNSTQLVHVWLTVPFILSWSLMEAMATGCCIVASATPPVKEMITSGAQGIGIFDPDALAQQVDHLLQN